MQEYLALSHCWGGLNFAKTTRKRLVDYKKRIPRDLLLKTFADAISITRKLGFRYLWIDAFCIVQDDADDWARESAKMAQIFGQAYLTIVAVASENGHGGCYHSRRSGREQFLCTVPNTNATLTYRSGLDHDFVSLLHGHGSRESEKPLFGRKWCYQERMLGQRLLYYTAHEIVWECRSSILCECGSRTPHTFKTQGWETSQFAHKLHFFKALNNPRTLVFGSNEQHAVLSVWQKMTMEYSRMDISYADDILPAFSGIASSFASTGLGTYYAGLWSSTLTSNLCWKSSSNAFGQAVNQRASIYTAPTWSWASVQGEIYVWTWLHAPPPRGLRKVDTANILRVDVQPSTVDPYGRLTSAALELEANARTATVVDKTANSWEAVIAFVDWPETMTYDLDTEQDFAALRIGDTVWVVLIQRFFLKFNEPSFYLLLRENDDGTFRRIGNVQGEREDEMNYAIMKRFCIV
jgi:hypothetical protein